MLIKVVVPFEGARNNTSAWAFEEESIDFRRQTERAIRCTMAFAAMEIRSYLCKICEQAQVVFESERAGADFCIELCITDAAAETDSFTLEPHEWGLRIIGQNRTGLLYGTYEFLRLQGVRWHAPGNDGDYLPPNSTGIVKPESIIKSTPSMKMLRGFDFEGVSKESAELLLWMARNRLNMCGYRVNTAALAQKLGMKLRVGGHIFESLLDPDRRLQDGSTLWEAHQNWYGLPADGRRVKNRALSTQFCVCQEGLREFLAGELVALLKGKWSNADFVDIWGFDTWGSTCNCADCIKLGNSSDQTLFFLSALRTAIDADLQTGQLSHNVRLTMCAYEGTATIDGPRNPIPQNLINAGDFVIFYPINRCYAHNINDTTCTRNRRYMAALNTWIKARTSLPIMVGEYYNVSKFEDLPLLFTDRITADICKYHSFGVRGMTYMHIPMVNWAERTLTQNLYAQMCWDANTDLKLFLEEYFSNRYGPYRHQMQSAYDLINRAWLYISDWRAWGQFSVLSQLLQWDGTAATASSTAESCDSHFANAAEAINSGRNSIKLLQEAMDTIDRLRQEDRIAAAQNTTAACSAAVNPIQAQMVMAASKYEMRLEEDRRLLLYGIDSLSLLVELVSYQDALCCGDLSMADNCWMNIEALATKLSSYYMPIDYEWPGAGLMSKDALTRTQVRELLRRCRKYRLDCGYPL
jgi:hypothetical protein